VNIADVMNWEQKGYDAFVQLWADHGTFPTASDCPARYMKEGSDERRAFIRGWNKAKTEAQ